MQYQSLTINKYHSKSITENAFELLGCCQEGHLSYGIAVTVIYPQHKLIYDAQKETWLCFNVPHVHSRWQHQSAQCETKKQQKSDAKYIILMQ